MNSYFHPQGMKATIVSAVILTVVPAAGALLAPVNTEVFFEFPPVTLYTSHPDFDIFVFSLFFCIALVSLLFFAPCWIVLLKERALSTPPLSPAVLISTVILIFFWIVAWTRISHFSLIQRHTFVCLWVSYILLVNSLSTALRGHSAFSKQPRRYLLSFPLSALFWWLFEYLNRFVQNWSYLEVHQYSSLEYLLLASLSFSTVLPAIWSTYCLLETAPGGATNKTPILSTHGSLALLSVSALILLLLPSHPCTLFALIWVAPIGVFYSQLCLLAPKKASSFIHSPQISCWALSGLICGFFWELWNYKSAAKWIYHIPWVEALYIFEMPALGYAGYLPFGVLCGIVLHSLFECRTESLREGAS